MNNKKLYRSTENSMLCGVCGGIGEYFDIDPVVVRLVWGIAGILSAGSGILAYILAIIVIPKKY